MSEEPEAIRARRARERAERIVGAEYVEIGQPGAEPKIVKLTEEMREELVEQGVLEPAEEKAIVEEPVDFTALAKCRESCDSLKEDLGMMNQLEIEEWRKSVTEQRNNAAARKDIADWSAFQRELGCVTKWQEQCEAEISECDKDCPELREEFQMGTDNVLSKQARNVISNMAIEKLDNVNLPRNEVVDASKQLKCLLKYEDCITGHKKKG